MSRTIPIALAADYALANTTLTLCLKVERRDETVIGLTSLDRALTVDGQLYSPGFDVSDLVSTSGLAVDNMDLSILEFDDVITEADALSGRWDQAKFTIFRVNYLAPANGVDVIKRGTTGDGAKTATGIWTIEFRGLTQALQQNVGELSSKTCRYRLGDSRCLVDLTPFTFDCAVTHVTGRQVFTDSSRTEDDEWFEEGFVTFTSGANEDVSQKVKIFAAGQFTTSLPLPFEIGIGDTFTAVAGCKKRHERSLANPSGISDCVDKFGNILRFGGEPHGEGVDGLTALPDVGGS